MENIDEKNIPSEKLVTNPGIGDWPDDYFIHTDATCTIIIWSGFPLGAVKNSSVKWETRLKNGDHIVNTFDGKRYLTLGAVRECNAGALNFYIRESCFPIKWEIK